MQAKELGGEHCEAVGGIMKGLFLSAGQSPMMYLNQLGVEAMEPMRDPCWLSKGVNDFWGRRWNLAVHGFLRRIFFLPVLKHSGKAPTACPPPPKR